ncbi:beta-eliminating lyase-related protein [Saccharibacillus sp. CPCC 101409]|uniref:threonine aldolase family protein n=1 Tax=Saccharibacillus sp. CPCC 101409 TaxID=3058041 RepID=UPI0026721F11|nr:beta-eliminating lyase-related protein [Saccharibacillus sp. CPCC 101409]MDO3411571.1 beta-eliminating lyase-related protein [Saccharibacillus sp. CPCC 101409]
MESLSETFQNASCRTSGSGPRSVQVLLDALQGEDGGTPSDMYGKGETIERFERKLARMLGKEAAVFFPSGTMAQQIALRIWSDRKGSKVVAYHPLCHLEIHEQDGLRELHHLEPVLLGTEDRLITLDDVKNMPVDVRCLLLELPQREIGGQLPGYAELEEISAYCREKGIALHLDGARLFEILPFYQKTAEEVCALFDSVYVSFYKGVGGIAGAMLAGDADLAQQSKVWKRRHGGDLISLYPYILSSDYYLDRRLPQMARYYEEAKELAALYNDCFGIRTLPEVPVSNMFHLHLSAPRETAERVVAGVQAETGIGLAAYLRETGESACATEISIGDSYRDVPKDELREAVKLLGERLAQANRS